MYPNRIVVLSYTDCHAIKMFHLFQSDHRLLLIFCLQHTADWNDAYINLTFADECQLHLHIGMWLFKKAKEKTNKGMRWYAFFDNLFDPFFSPHIFDVEQMRQKHCNVMFHSLSLSCLS